MKNVPEVNSHRGSAKPLAVVVLVLLAIAAGAWWMTQRQAGTQNPGAVNQNPSKPAAELPPLPEKYYDISGTIKELKAGSFTVAARIRTDKNTLVEGFRDAVLTVSYDSATVFQKRGAYTGNGQVPGAVKASSKDLAVGEQVDIHSRENIHGLDSFMAAQVTIKAPATK